MSSPGTSNARRRYSPAAGVMNSSGSNGCSPGSAWTTERTRCAVVSPLARHAPTSAPEDTPTVTGTSLKSTPSSASSSARSAPIS